MQHKEPVSVLISPLDWGLGHATRCIPIIRELLKQGAKVVIASSGPQKALLQAEFPDIEILDLPGYSIRYKKGIFLKWALIFRIPSILKQIEKEKLWLEGILRSRKLDAVISDNRYGLYHKDLYNVFLTHQPYIYTALGSFFDRIILKWHYDLIRKFSVCWIPDWPGYLSLAGKLSHPKIPMPIPHIYIGLLSRLKPLQKNVEKNTLLILLSGPEPQRTQFEKSILLQVEHLCLKCTVVRGLPGKTPSDSFPLNDIQIVDHLPAEELNFLLNSSDLILTRSGYSSIMDLVQLGKNAILVPTSGQTEQEYLGKHLHEMNWMFTVPQKNLNLKKAIQQFRSSHLTLPQLPEPVLGNVIEEFINKCIKIRRTV
jgi:UDP:flavonoid glycosyltransferase YjiC (YdhE family)